MTETFETKSFGLCGGEPGPEESKFLGNDLSLEPLNPQPVRKNSRLSLSLPSKSDGPGAGKKNNLKLGFQVSKISTEEASEKFSRRSCKSFLSLAAFLGMKTWEVQIKVWFNCLLFMFLFFKLCFLLFALIIKYSSYKLIPLIDKIRNKHRAPEIYKPLRRTESNSNFVLLRKISDDISLQNKPQEGGFTLILDLDKTLIFSTKYRMSAFDEEVVVKNAETLMPEKIYFSKRPFLSDFLDQMSQFYKLIVFTASQKDYADAIIDKIDKKRMISQRFYRDSCIKSKDGFIKDISIVDKDISRLIMIDDSRVASKFNENNCILIKPWEGNNSGDDELHELIGVLMNWVGEKGDARHLIKALRKERI